MRRIVVIGGTGFFGGAIIRHLRALGHAPLAASRRGVDMQIDAEDRAVLRNRLLPGDVVIDAAGPFLRRTTALVETAMEKGFDVIDMADSIIYARAVAALEDRINASGICVLTSCSTHSAVSAALVALSGVKEPRRARSLLVPVTRETASPTVVSAFLPSVGRPVEIFRNGTPALATGWRATHHFRLPPRRGYLIASTDVWALPRAFPTLRGVDAWLDVNAFMGNQILAAAALTALSRRLLLQVMPRLLPLTRIIGRRWGGASVEVEDTEGWVAGAMLSAERDGYLTAIAPAVLAASTLATETFPHVGLVPAHKLVEPHALTAYLARHGIRLQRMELQQPRGIGPR